LLGPEPLNREEDISENPPLPLAGEQMKLKVNNYVMANHNKANYFLRIIVLFH